MRPVKMTSQRPSKSTLSHMQTQLLVTSVGAGSWPRTPPAVGASLPLQPVPKIQSIPGHVRCKTHQCHAFSGFIVTEDHQLEAETPGRGRSVPEGRTVKEITVDDTSRGNASRWINHSCEPNMRCEHKDLAVADVHSSTACRCVAALRPVRGANV